MARRTLTGVKRTPGSGLVRHRRRWRPRPRLHWFRDDDLARGCGVGRSTVRRWLAALRHDAPRRVHAGPAVTLKSPGDLPWRGLVIRRDTARLFAARHLPGVPWLLEDAGP